MQLELKKKKMRKKRDLIVHSGFGQISASIASFSCFNNISIICCFFFTFLVFEAGISMGGVAGNLPKHICIC